MGLDRSPPHTQLAAARDRRLAEGGSLDWEVGRPSALLTAIRIWFKADTAPEYSAVDRLIRLDDDPDPRTATLTCGERKTGWHQRRNGLRCHFRMVLRHRTGAWRVVSYSFQVDQPEAQPLVPGSPAYVRYDYTEEPQSDPVSHPLCHLTPGNKSLRLPAAPLTPKELASWYLSLEPW